MYFLGLDPGSQGCAVLLDAFKSPTTGKVKCRYLEHLNLLTYNRMEMKALQRFFHAAHAMNARVWIEEPVPTHYGKGTALLVQGANFGYLYGCAATIWADVSTVFPSSWQSALGTKGKNNDDVCRDILRDECGMDWRKIAPRSKTNCPEGLLDATCIAYYGALQCLGDKV